MQFHEAKNNNKLMLHNIIVLIIQSVFYFQYKHLSQWDKEYVHYTY